MSWGNLTESRIGLEDGPAYGAEGVTRLIASCNWVVDDDNDFWSVVVGGVNAAAVVAVATRIAADMNFIFLFVL
jgi:hypothetical protein